MPNVEQGLQSVHVAVFDDDTTPCDFVIDLLRSVFGQTESSAITLVDTVEEVGRAVCGPFPADAAEKLVQAARRRVKASGLSLRLALEPIDAGTACDEAPWHDASFEERSHRSKPVRSRDDRTFATERSRPFKYVYEAIGWHFAGLPPEQLVATARKFPGHMRADLQAALDKRISTAAIRFLGIFEEHRYETLTFAALTRSGRDAHAIAPAQYHEVDIGEPQAVRCLVNGLWLCCQGDFHYAVVQSFHREYDRDAGACIEIAVPLGEAGGALTQNLFADLEAAVHASRSYRGKVLSLEVGDDYRGRATGMTVHRLEPVTRDQIILSDATVELLDRNTLKFVDTRDALRALGQSTRKGILLYGPPGTGKTHTIRYLASNLPEHTTLLITAGQVGLLRQYMTLARLLQPTMVVIEDVDLIARDRERLAGACEESLLNRLLNEMDGLADSADIIFVLTTNRPEQLEGALAGRPGRIDQAIEVPLPDEVGREKLVRLYGRDLSLAKALVAEAVARTEGVSAAFIKEMMRRMVQASIQRGAGQSVTAADLRDAVDDMLIKGGRLNLKLLGGVP